MILLVSIDNQRGAKTEVSYAPTTNAAVVAQQHATMPQIQWVVQSQTTTDTLDVPTTMATTSYGYVDPHFGPDERGHYSLRGFEQIETTLPSGAMREDEERGIERRGGVERHAGDCSRTAASACLQISTNVDL